MSYSLHLHDRFAAEVRAALEYYSAEAPEMVGAFLAELDATMSRIAAHPTTPRVVRGTTRAVHMGSPFPYSVLYVVHEHLELVDLTIFLHDRQDQHGLLPRFR